MSVVLFSGGSENLHCKMPSVGRSGGASPRLVVQLWVQCADPGQTPSGQRTEAAAKARNLAALGGGGL